jgi:hypothetical protein
VIRKAEPLEGQTVRADKVAARSRQRVQAKDSQDPHARNQLRCSASSCGRLLSRCAGERAAE